MKGDGGGMPTVSNVQGEEVLVTDNANNGGSSRVIRLDALVYEIRTGRRRYC